MLSLALSLVTGAMLDVAVVHVSTGVEVNPAFEHHVRAKVAQWSAAEGPTFRPSHVAAGHLASSLADGRLAAMSPMDTDEPGRPGGPGRIAARPAPHRPTVLVTFGTICGKPAFVDLILRELSALDVDLRGSGSGRKRPSRTSTLGRSG